MRRQIAIASAALLIGVAIALAMRENQGDDKLSRERDKCSLVIELVDAANGTPLPGVITVRDDAGKRVHIPELLPRGQGVGESYAIHDWYIVPLRSKNETAVKVTLPQQKLTVRAFYGLETEFGEATLDLGGKAEEKLRIPLKRFYDAHAKGLQSANTHVHVQKVSLDQSDRYLLEVARAERLDVVYISYLERAEADLEYTSNKYTLDDLHKLTERSRTPHTHTHGPGGQTHTHQHGTKNHHSERGDYTEFDNGQEHRHNFGPQEEGYGHVMLLHLSERVQPVSIGPGITKKGTDSPPLARGIEKARDLGSTIIWCHNQWGLEDIPNGLSGKLHANNIFDGGTHGSYKHSFYRYLNAGLKVPFSTGTDWFIYDFSRVYVIADDDSDGKGKVGGGKHLSSEQWLEHLAAGRSYITNGPLLEFTVNGRRLGDTIELKQPGKVKIAGRAEGRLNFQRIELVQNGEVVKTAPSRPQAGHFAAELEIELPIDQPCWLALRTPPPSTPREAEFAQKTPLNEYGRELFAHTSAVYVRLAGRDVFDVSAAQSLLDEMKSSREFIREKAKFANDDERDGAEGVRGRDQANAGANRGSTLRVGQLAATQSTNRFPPRGSPPWRIVGRTETIERNHVTTRACPRGTMFTDEANTARLGQAQSWRGETSVPLLFHELRSIGASHQQGQTVGLANWAASSNDTDSARKRLRHNPSSSSPSKQFSTRRNHFFGCGRGAP